MAYLEMKGITKVFPGVVALDHINFSAEKGEVHAIAGENGAGKSTLIKTLSGAYRQKKEKSGWMENRCTLKTRSMVENLELWLFTRNLVSYLQQVLLKIFS